MMAPVVIRGDARALPLPDASVDAIVCDPPYELGFMNRTWDSTGVAFDTGPWEEALRVLKPGGHLAAFGASRTFHRLACAIEGAGFEMRDTVAAWLYGSGFPKSLDVGKAIDGHVRTGRSDSIAAKETNQVRPGLARTRGSSTNGHRGLVGSGSVGASEHRDTPATDAARAWQGWGTALKPAWEPIVLARKPLSGTVAANVLAHGVGAIHVDACRVNPGAHVGDGGGGQSSARRAGLLGEIAAGNYSAAHDAGRWPTNVVLAHHPDCGPDEAPEPCAPGCQVAALDEQSGTLSPGNRPAVRNTALGIMNDDGWQPQRQEQVGERMGAGGASRFFPTFRYEAKAPAWQRPRLADGSGFETVKPLDLMRWLVRLLAPPDGRVLDMFPGTGTTGQAAQLEGFASVLVEKEARHLGFIRERLAQDVIVDRPTGRARPVTPVADREQGMLFGAVS